MKRRLWTTDEIDTLAHMRSAGATHSQMALKLGRSLAAVRTMEWQTRHLCKTLATPPSPEQPARSRANFVDVHASDIEKLQALGVTVTVKFGALSYYA